MEAQGSHGQGTLFGFVGEMIEFTDMTLRQARGYFNETKKLMDEDGSVPEWMLRSSVFVSTQFVSATYTLHFWKNGRVVIHATDRPMQMDSLDDDLRELSQWCHKAGWAELSVSDELLADRHAYEFWKRSFIAGLIVNEQLQQHEEEEMTRLSKAYLNEKKEEDDGT